MKNLLTIVLLVAFVSPSFAFADDRSEREGKKEAHKYAQEIRKEEKKKYKEEKREEKREEKKEHKEEKKEVRKPKKVNYFFCVTATDWKIVPVPAHKDNNNSNYLGADCVKLPSHIAKKLQRIMDGTTATTTPDIVAPIITLATATGVTTTGATISWTTNESANGNVYFSTSTPVNMASSSTLGTSVYSIPHSFNLTGLAASTTYYYVVKSADVANNVATSSQYSFTTPAVPDTTAPVISGVTISGVASTTATVAWNTNELASGKLFYGTSTPLTTFVYNPTLSLAHTFSLTSLNASSTYQLLFESKDASGNTSTTTSSFVTTN